MPDSRHSMPPSLPSSMPRCLDDMMPSPIEHLLQRMQAGDRAAAAEFLLRYESRIRRRVRAKIGPAIRRLFDSLDILSTLGRRLDGYVVSGNLRAESEGECLSLLFKIADNAMIDKARLVQRLAAAEGEDGDFAQLMASRLRHAGRAGREHSTNIEIEIEGCMRMLRDPHDRRILSLWLAGEQHKDIATLMQLSADGVRKRWQNIRATLRERLGATA